MGWVTCSSWEKKQDVLDDWTHELESQGYKAHLRGNWAYVEKNGDPVDLIYILTNKTYGMWGYKDISVSCGPLCYSAPLWMVLKIHQIFKGNTYYQGWLEKYPKKESVLQKLKKEKL